MTAPFGHGGRRLRRGAGAWDPARVGSDDRVGGAPATTVTVPAPGMPPRRGGAGSAGEPAGEAAVTSPDDRYVVEGEVARGGFGRVVTAHDTKLGRRVAVKLPTSDAGQHDARLVREAEILAGLEHPAIVPVHDAGRWRDGRPFVAMRLLGRRTLRDAIAEAIDLDRRLALLPAAVAIADAIAFAHARGVVHRDLKPSNVIVGELGDTVVIDWGLAARVGDADGGAAASSPNRASATDQTLTATGAIAGTPAYMAPELFRGERADQRSDVYAIGVVLYEILTGVRPHTGPRPNAPDAADSPVIPLAERESRIQRALAAVVAKATAPDPVARYADAGALADDLRRYQDGRLVAAHRYSRVALAGRWLRRRAVVVATTAAVVTTGVAVAAFALGGGPDPVEACGALAGPVRDRWTPARAGELERGFLGTGDPYARPVWGRIAPRIAQQTERIAAMRAEACQAHARGAQSAAALDLRMSCLDRRTDRLDAVLAAIATPDPDLVARAIDIVDTLGPVDDCADLAALSGIRPLPDEPERRTRVVALYREVEGLEVESERGRIPTVAAIDGLLERVRGAEHAPLEARALEVASMISAHGGDEARSERLSRAQIVAADAAGIDHLRLSATLRLVHLLVEAGARDPQLAQLRATATALVTRTGRLDQFARHLATLATSHRIRGHLTAALPLALAGMSLAEALPGRPAWIRGQAHNSVATVLFDLGDAAGSAEQLDLAEAAYREYLGESHPTLIKLGMNRAGTLSRLGDRPGAIAAFARVVSDLERDAPESRTMVQALMGQANALNQDGREREGLAVGERALALARRVLGPDTPEVRSLLSNLADSQWYLKDYPAAVARYREALALGERIAAPPARLAETHLRLGFVLRDMGDLAAAVDELQAAIAIYDADPEPDRERGYALNGLGMCQYDLGEVDDAIATLRAARPFLEATGDRSELARQAFYLARALWDAGRDRREALALAADAKAGFAADGAVSADDLAKVDAWIGERTAR
jgi:eukaryotic-like serine/threonine-protein kinase